MFSNDDNITRNVKKKMNTSGNTPPRGHRCWRSDGGLYRTFSHAHHVGLCGEMEPSLQPAGPGFPESGRNCPQQGGGRGPSNQGCGPGQGRNWPQSQFRAVSEQTQRGHFLSLIYTVCPGLGVLLGYEIQLNWKRSSEVSQESQM